MYRILRISLTALVLVSFVSACLDHRLGPLAPQRLRLKTVTTAGIINPMFLTTFEYDAQNRQVGYTNLSYYGSGYSYHGTITYNAQGQYQQIDEELNGSLSSRTFYSYQPDGQGGQLVTASGYSVSQPINGGQTPNAQAFYQFDANNRLVGSGLGSTTTVYSYTGDNITRAENKSQNRILTYEYDNTPNPFYGIIGFLSQSLPTEGEAGRFSRNNIVRMKTNDGGGSGNSIDYNAQGLPTRINLFTLAYESY